MKIAWLSGTSIAHSPLFASWETRTQDTTYGTVHYRTQGDQIVLNRHGFGAPLPPHRINHRAHIRALAELGCTQVIAFNSVGSLKPELEPGTLISCADYVSLLSPPTTFFDDELKGGAPAIRNDLIPALTAALLPEFPVRTGLVYVQMAGPRFETKAEIQIIRHWGDVVGMTAAPEADLCTEAGLGYNSLGIVDNYANGLTQQGIDFARFKELVRANQAKVNAVFTRLLAAVREFA